METVDDLFKTIRRNLSHSYKINHIPKRCHLNQHYDLKKEPGYVVELIHNNGGIDLLFIADIADIEYFHNASYTFVNSIFNNRCLWIDEDDITYINTEGFYI